MTEKILKTERGNIHYLVSKNNSPISLIFLPGLTADYRLFLKQLNFFKNKYNVMVWDAPGHYHSQPFKLGFSLKDKAYWLKRILEKEKLSNPIIIGQSMGGYLGQAFLQYFPGLIKGFIVLDSAPLKREYISTFELWILKRMEPIYRIIPWNLLKMSAVFGCAHSNYGRALMFRIVSDYDTNKNNYIKLAADGFRMLAQAIELDLPYDINCPALFICGDKDHAGSAKNYMKRWSKKTEIPIKWIKNAGHNCNTDQPDEVNQIIENFIMKIST